MTKAAAMYQFWRSFGLPTYEENSVPTGDNAPALPYLTYQFATDDFGKEVALTGSLWYRSTSWTQANEKAEEISKAIGRGGKMLPCDGGAIWIKKGTPFAQNMSDESDDKIKRKYLNLVVEYFTAD
jgi:hypothetical protein